MTHTRDDAAFARRWFLSRQQPSARKRLVCFAHAGGMPTGFASWQAALGPGIEVHAVQTPGKGTRYREAPVTDFRALVAELGPALRSLDDLPCAYFGHSLGALLAFECARLGAAQGGPRPTQLFLSGCAAPTFHDAEQRVYALDDASLINTLAGYEGTPAEVLENAELLQLLLPMIRADFALVNDYSYRPGPPLDIPLTILAGRGDGEVSPKHVPAWSAESMAPTEVLWFDGGHFFPSSASQAVLACLKQRLLP